MNEQILAAAIARLTSLGELKTVINPNLNEFDSKSIAFATCLDGIEIAVEMENFPNEKLIFWNDGVEVSEKAWAEALDEWEELN